MFPLGIGAVPVRVVAVARLRAALPDHGPQGDARAIGSSESCSSNAAAKSAAATRDSMSERWRASCRRRSSPTAASRSRPSGCGAIRVVRWLADDPYPAGRDCRSTTTNPQPDDRARARERVVESLRIDHRTRCGVSIRGLPNRPELACRPAPRVLRGGGDRADRPARRATRARGRRRGDALDAARPRCSTNAPSSCARASRRRVTNRGLLGTLRP